MKEGRNRIRGPVLFPKISCFLARFSYCLWFQYAPKRWLRAELLNTWILIEFVFSVCCVVFGKRKFSFSITSASKHIYIQYINDHISPNIRRVFSLLSLFWKYKNTPMRSPCMCVCIPPPHQLLYGWTSLYEAWYVYHGTWAHLNGAIHKSLPSVCVSICIFPYRC
jgi:hypothetical protein